MLVVAACGDDAVDPADAEARDLYGVWLSEATPERPEVYAISFHERGVYHPALATARDVYTKYELTSLGQKVTELGTYRVEGGVLYRTGVWIDGATLATPTEYERSLLAITRGGLLSIEGPPGASLPADYQATDRCEVPLRRGWRTYAVQRATYTMRDQPGGNPIDARFTADGRLVGALQGAVFAYGDDCIPEVGDDYVGRTSLVPTSDGMHVLIGGGVGDARASMYSKLGASGLPLPEPQALGAMARDVVDAADLGGTLAVLTGTPTAPSIVRADGVVLTPTNLPPAFVARTLVGVGANAMIIGTGSSTGFGARLYLVEQSGAGWTNTLVPFEVNAAYIAAATVGDDLYIVHMTGSDPGAKRPRVLFLTRRIAGTWIAPVAIGLGADPRITVVDGIVYVASSYVTSSIETSAQVWRVDGDVSTGWSVAEGFVHDPNAYIAPAIPAARADGTFAVGYISQLFVRKPDDRITDTVPFEVRITGNGRVTSSDGVVNCTQTCTVQVELDRVLLLRAESATAAPSEVVGAIDPGNPAYAYRVMATNVSPLQVNF